MAQQLQHYLCTAGLLLIRFRPVSGASLYQDRHTARFICCRGYRQTSALAVLPSSGPDSSRTQYMYVRRSTARSTTVRLICPVPQGLVLGPILFIMYTAEEVCGSTRTRGYGSGTGRCLTGRVGYEVHGSGIPVFTRKEHHFSRR